MSEETTFDDDTSGKPHLVVTKRLMAALVVAAVFFVGLTSFALGRVTADSSDDHAEHSELMRERGGPRMERGGPRMERGGPGMERGGPRMERMPEGQSGINNG